MVNTKPLNRIDLDSTTVIDAIFALAGGNPGAISVLMTLMQEPSLDLADVFATLDMLEIYESRIWMLYKDVCKQNIQSFVALLYAWKFGIITETELNHGIDNYGALKPQLPIISPKRMLKLHWQNTFRTRLK